MFNADITRLNEACARGLGPSPGILPFVTGTKNEDENGVKYSKVAQKQTEEEYQKDPVLERLLDCDAKDLESLTVENFANQEDMVEFQLLETMQELKEVEEKRAALKRIDNELECAMRSIVSH